MNTRIVIINRRQHGNLGDLSVASVGARQRFLVKMTTENVAFVCTVRYSRCWQPINDSALGRWPLITGNLTLKCVGTLTKCPHTAGGRSRRGSPKAGTTVAIYDSFDNALLFVSERMQDGVGLGQVYNMSPRDSHPVTKVDGTDLIKIFQSKFSSAGHLIIMNRCRNVISS